MFSDPERNRLRHQVGDDFEQIVIPFELLFPRDLPVDADRADHLALMDHRHTDERHVRVAFPRAGAVEKLRLPGNVRDNSRLPGKRHLSGDSLAQSIVPAAHLLVAQSVRRLDDQLLSPPQRHRAPHQPHLAAENLQHLAQQSGDVALAHHRPADVVQHRHLQAPAALDFSGPSLIRHCSVTFPSRRIPPEF